MSDDDSAPKYPSGSLYSALAVLGAATAGSFLVSWWLKTRQAAETPPAPGEGAAAAAPDPLPTFKSAARPRPRARPVHDLRSRSKGAVKPTPPDPPANDDLPTVQEEIAAPSSGEPASDDLTAINGIGPKIAQVLHEAGIRTWEDLAGRTGEELREILLAANPRYRIFDPDPWPEQAARAAGERREKQS